MKNNIGQKVCNESITIVDDATLPDEFGSQKIDDEGNITQKNYLIQEGVVSTYLSNNKMARLVKRNPSGSARRESYEFEAVPRMTNTYLDKGSNNSANIIQSLDKGIYIQKASNASVNRKEGTYAIRGEISYFVEKGQCRYPLGNLIIGGNLSSCLQDISLIGDDLAHFAGGCKAGSGLIPISAGGPTVRIENLHVMTPHD
jgi:TldD protein